MEFPVLLLEGLIVMGVIKGVRTAWQRWRASQSAHPIIGGQALSRSSTDLFFDHPDTRRAMVELRAYLGTPEGSNPANVCWFLFARLAQLNPFLVREYDQLFEVQPSPVLVMILAQCGDDETKAMLARHRTQTPACAEMIEWAMENWNPGFIRPLERKPESNAELDLLWCEYRVTRDLAAVRHIIDVLEWPDEIRRRLEDWLIRASADEAREWAAKLFHESSVLCDADSREVLSRQDLDYVFLMEGLNMSKERVDRLPELLPFAFSKDELAASPALVKVAACWSLASHASQFPEIHELCRNELRTRSGRCRLTILQILARLAGGSDLQNALNYFGESLQPEGEDERAVNIAAEWDRLMLLTADHISADALRPVPADACARCVAAFEEIRSYRARWLMGTPESGESGPPIATWEAQIERGGRFRVLQNVGHDFDHWITFPEVHFRGPMYQPGLGTEANDRRRNSTLTCDVYLPLLGMPAARSGMCGTGVGDWWFFEYLQVPPPWTSHLDVDETPAEEVDLRCDLQLWVDPATARIRKVFCIYDDGSTLTHLFATYNEPVEIFPPPFSLFEKSAA